MAGSRRLPQVVIEIPAMVVDSPSPSKHSSAGRGTGWSNPAGAEAAYPARVVTQPSCNPEPSRLMVLRRREDLQVVPTHAPIGCSCRLLIDSRMSPPNNTSENPIPAHPESSIPVKGSASPTVTSAFLDPGTVEDDVEEDEGTEDDVEEDEGTEDDVEEDEGTEDDVEEDEGTEDDVEEDDGTEDDVEEDDGTEDDVEEDDGTEDDVEEDDGTEDDVVEDGGNTNTSTSSTSRLFDGLLSGMSPNTTTSLTYRPVMAVSTRSKMVEDVPASSEPITQVTTLPRRRQDP